MTRAKVLQAAVIEKNITTISSAMQKKRGFDSDHRASGAHLGSLQGFCFCSVVGRVWGFLVWLVVLLRWFLYVAQAVLELSL